VNGSGDCWSPLDKCVPKGVSFLMGLALGGGACPPQRPNVPRSRDFWLSHMKGKYYVSPGLIYKKVKLCLVLFGADLGGRSLAATRVSTLSEFYAALGVTILVLPNCISFAYSRGWLLWRRRAGVCVRGNLTPPNCGTIQWLDLLGRGVMWCGSWIGIFE
jgi:hypothetical protein